MGTKLITQYTNKPLNKNLLRGLLNHLNRFKIIFAREQSESLLEQCHRCHERSCTPHR